MFLVCDASMSEMLGRCGMDSLGELRRLLCSLCFVCSRFPADKHFIARETGTKDKSCVVCYHFVSVFYTWWGRDKVGDARR